VQQALQVQRDTLEQLEQLEQLDQWERVPLAQLVIKDRLYLLWQQIRQMM
jgi:hypothetical protein